MVTLLVVSPAEYRFRWIDIGLVCFIIRLAN